MTEPSLVAAHTSPERALGDEERHLGVVGNGAQQTVCGRQARHAIGPVPFANLLQRHELDRGAKRIAQRASEQTAHNALPLG